MVEPFVVTVIPTFQEGEFIERCLRSLLEQTWPSERHLIHVVDGGSSDGTREIVAEMQKKSKQNDGPEIILLDNPDKYVPHARNISLSQLPDEVTHIFEMIGHVWLPSQHIEARMNEFDEIESKLAIDGKKLAGVGTLVKESDQPLKLVGRWVEASLQNPLASGRGQFAQFSGLQETIIPPFTIYRRDAIEAAEGWNTDFITTQDSELNMRLVNDGWSLFRSDSSYCRMAKRTSISGWLRFGHRYGFWRTKHLLKTPERASILEFLPWIGLLATLGLCWSGTELLGYPTWQIPVVAYLIVLILHSILEAISHSQISLIIGLPIMLILLHITFSWGLLDGLLRRGRAPKDRIS